MIHYNPSDWYWQITSGAEVYGSARRGLVAAPTTDVAYLAWSAINGPGSIAPNSAALDAVLATAGLPASGLTPPTALQLNQYANGKVLGLLVAERLYSGASVAGVTMPSGVTGITCAEGPAAANLLSINAWGQAAPAATQQWTDDLYAVFTLTGAQAVTFSDAALAYGQSLYAMLATAALAIKAGTITTTAQIDALAWPV
jgi:hypothetical protein